jgi:hypothetical protein
MDVLWMGLGIFAVILTSFFIVMAITKGAFFLVKGNSGDPLRSSWVPLQVYSGDDSLGHPDLQKISELHEITGLNEETDSI